MWPNIPFLGPKCRIDSLLGGDWWLYIYDKADWGQYAERMRNEVPQIRWSPIKITFGRTFFGWLTFLGVWEHAKNQRGKKKLICIILHMLDAFLQKVNKNPYSYLIWWVEQKFYKYNLLPIERYILTHREKYPKSNSPI